MKILKENSIFILVMGLLICLLFSIMVFPNQVRNLIPGVLIEKTAVISMANKPITVSIGDNLFYSISRYIDVVANYKEVTNDSIILRIDYQNIKIKSNNGSKANVGYSRYLEKDVYIVIESVDTKTHELKFHYELK